MTAPIKQAPSQTEVAMGEGFAYFRWMCLHGRSGKPTYFWAWKAQRLWRFS